MIETLQIRDKDVMYNFDDSCKFSTTMSNYK